MLYVISYIIYAACFIYLLRKCYCYFKENEELKYSIRKYRKDNCQLRGDIQKVEKNYELLTGQFNPYQIPPPTLNIGRFPLHDFLYPCPTRTEECFTVLHKIPELIIPRLEQMLEPEDCWLEKVKNSERVQNNKIVVDIIVHSEQEEKLEFAKYLIEERLKKCLSFYKSLPQKNHVPMSVIDIRKQACQKCEYSLTCLAKHGIETTDFKCPKEEDENGNK